MKALRQKLHHHSSRARDAWKSYYHYKRLEEHGNSLPYHGRKRKRRAIVVGILLAALIAYGLYHTL
jgi:hypothetical protein